MYIVNLHGKIMIFMQFDQPSWCLSTFITDLILISSSHWPREGYTKFLLCISQPVRRQVELSCPEVSFGENLMAPVGNTWSEWIQEENWSIWQWVRLMQLTRIDDGWFAFDFKIKNRRQSNWHVTDKRYRLVSEMSQTSPQWQVSQARNTVL